MKFPAILPLLIRPLYGERYSIGAASESELVERLRAVERDAKAGYAPAPAAPAESDLRATERLAIDYANCWRTDR